MKMKLAWYLATALLLGLSTLNLSCALIEPPNPPPPVATIVLPAMPHSLEVQDGCRRCHEKGILGAPEFPDDHSRRPSDVCTACHIKAPANSGGGAVNIALMPLYK